MKKFYRVINSTPNDIDQNIAGTKHEQKMSGISGFYDIISGVDKSEFDVPKIDFIFPKERDNDEGENNPYENIKREENASVTIADTIYETATLKMCKELKTIEIDIGENMHNLSAFSSKNESDESESSQEHVTENFYKVPRILIEKSKCDHTSTLTPVLPANFANKSELTPPPIPRASDKFISQSFQNDTSSIEMKKVDQAFNMDAILKFTETKYKHLLMGFRKRRKTEISRGKTITDKEMNGRDITMNESKVCDVDACLYDLENTTPKKNVRHFSTMADHSTAASSFPDFGKVRWKLIKHKNDIEGQNGFDDLTRYVKQGGDFCKEIASIMQERTEAEMAYARTLSKLAAKLSRVCRDGVGALNDAWKAVGREMEARAESHRTLGAALLGDIANPLRDAADERQRARKREENAVDKATKYLVERRLLEAKAKKNSHACARENERLQDAMSVDNSRLSRTTSLIQLGKPSVSCVQSEKEHLKLEAKKRKAEEAVKKADIEYYALCVRAERARLEWESTVIHGSSVFQDLEEERLKDLKKALIAYLKSSLQHVPKLTEAGENLRDPTDQSDPYKDLATFVKLRNTSSIHFAEQLLPDFYCEHFTLAMNRDRRKDALIKLLCLIREDVARERKSKTGLENLSRAMKQTPNFGAEDSDRSLLEKLQHMKSMLTYLEGARYKIQNALVELQNLPKTGHPLAAHIIITRDKTGLQQSILKVPQWLKEDWNVEIHRGVESSKNQEKENVFFTSSPTDWSSTIRGSGDGISTRPDDESDFDESLSECSSSEVTAKNEFESADQGVCRPVVQCKALFCYEPKLNDELALREGDCINVYKQQDDGWWLGECRGKVGNFPSTYVKIFPNQI